MPEGRPPPRRPEYGLGPLCVRRGRAFEALCCFPDLRNQRPYLSCYESLLASSVLYHQSYQARNHVRRADASGTSNPNTSAACSPLILGRLNLTITILRPLCVKSNCDVRPRIQPHCSIAEQFDSFRFKRMQKRSNLPFRLLQLHSLVRVACKKVISSLLSLVGRLGMEFREETKVLRKAIAYRIHTNVTQIDSIILSSCRRK